jgi:hypothetical protein
LNEIKGGRHVIDAAAGCAFFCHSFTIRLALPHVISFPLLAVAKQANVLSSTPAGWVFQNRMDRNGRSLTEPKTTIWLWKTANFEGGVGWPFPENRRQKDR